jgi:hypothetical protein
MVEIPFAGCGREPGCTDDCCAERREPAVIALAVLIVCGDGS